MCRLHFKFLLLLGFSSAVIAFTHPLLRQSSLVRKRAPLPERRPATVRTHNPNIARRGASRYKNAKAAAFHVDGTKIPQVDFDVGDSWSGLLPISSNQNETRKLFFWYFPPTEKGNENDLIFWTNGGPGCSSLEGFLQENGPISWKYGQAKPTPNPYSWTNLGHVLWIDQPVGTGFSQGEPNIHNETELAAQFVGFMQQFLAIFSELNGKNFYLTGESYAGLYLPYIADYMFLHPTLLDLKIQGLWLGSPSLTEDGIAIQLPAVNFVNKNLNIFPFNQSFLAHINKLADKCNYTSYLNTFLKYPPPRAPFPPLETAAPNSECDVWSPIVLTALLLNPAFNIYRVFDMPPVSWDVLGFPGTLPQIQVSPVYFDRPDVKAAIHAPADVQWTECPNSQSAPVFVNSTDTSPPPSWEVLPRVLGKGIRTVVVTGLADFVLLSEGTRIAIQNMTWNHDQGFRHAPRQGSFILDCVGSFGTVQSERGLTFYELPITGHMIPQFNPPAAFQTMEFLLGNRAKP